MLVFLLIFLIIIVSAGFGVISIYNNLKANSLKVEEALSNISVFLQNRYEQISKAYQIAKEFKVHEEKMLGEIVRLRERLPVDSDGNFKIDKRHGEVSSMIPDILARLEAYPELRSNENYLDIQRQIEENEMNLSASRRSYNSYVNKYNTSIALFPSNLIADLFSFEKADLFEIEDPKFKTNPLD